MERRDPFDAIALILDADCVINLYASGQMLDVLSSIPCPVFISEYVRDREALRIFDGPEEDVLQTTATIRLEPLIEVQAIQVVSLETEAEEAAFLNLATSVDTGEAHTAAIATNRGWVLGTDDSSARNTLRRKLPHLRFVSTPEIMRHWVDTTGPGVDLVRSTLRRIELRARYRRHRAGVLYRWWQEYFEDE